MAETTDVVIVGGGVGGLAVAWNLTKVAQANKLPPPAITLVEASPRIGGNADTVQIDFGSGPGYPTGFRRWADLGVNDFNTTAYTLIVGVMNEIGFTEGTDYRNLEDTTSYYTADGALAFTDNDLATRFSSWNTQMPSSLSVSAKSFMKVAGEHATDPAFAAYTISQYIEEQGPKQNPPWDPDLGPKVIYPRINGMYFVSELGPREMPFAAVMHYYAIQEGAGGKPANRCYFVNGASAWIDALLAYMAKEMPNVTILTGYRAVINRVRTEGAMFLVQDAGGTQAPFAAARVVLAAHADDSLTAMMTGLPDGVGAVLGAIRYNNGISVAHTDSRLLPVNSNAWSTYNILIHEPGAAGLKPYVINYVANRHQNDAANPAYDVFGLPQFFVSCNPHRPIPENMILTDMKGNAAVANLRHNTFDFATMEAQSRIDAYQGVGGIYYAGGWTCGSGLHEECWQQGVDVASLLLLGHKAAVPEAAAKPKATEHFITDRLARIVRAA